MSPADRWKFILRYFELLENEWGKLDADAKKTEEMKIRQLLIPEQPVLYEKGNPITSASAANKAVMIVTRNVNKGCDSLQRES